jgi:hypothetical protein
MPFRSWGISHCWEMTCVTCNCRLGTVGAFQPWPRKWRDGRALRALLYEISADMMANAFVGCVPPPSRPKVWISSCLMEAG